MSALGQKRKLTRYPLDVCYWGHRRPEHETELIEVRNAALIFIQRLQNNLARQHPITLQEVLQTEYGLALTEYGHISFRTA